MTTDNTPTNNLSKKETVIAVVGGGIGGILTAIGLGKQGYTVHLFEQAAKFSEIGAGIAMYVSRFGASRRLFNRLKRGTDCMEGLIAAATLSVRFR